VLALAVGAELEPQRCYRVVGWQVWSRTMARILM
jgi:hypothetical protein